MANKNKMSKFKKWFGDTFFKNNEGKDKENNTEKLKHPLTFLLESKNKIADSIISECVGKNWDEDIRRKALDAKNYFHWRIVTGNSIIKNPKMSTHELAVLLAYSYSYLTKTWCLDKEETNRKHFTVGKLIDACQKSENKVPIIALCSIFNLFPIDLELYRDISTATMSRAVKEFSEAMAAFAEGEEDGWTKEELKKFARENLEAMSVLLALAVRALQGEVG